MNTITAIARPIASTRIKRDPFCERHRPRLGSVLAAQQQWPETLLRGTELALGAGRATEVCLRLIVWVAWVVSEEGAPALGAIVGFDSALLAATSQANSPLRSAAAGQERATSRAGS